MSASHSLVTEFHTHGPGLQEAREDTQRKTELPPYCPCQWGKPTDQQRTWAVIISGAFQSIEKWLLVQFCLPNLTQVFLVATANLEVYVEGACRIIPGQLSGCSSRPPHSLREKGVAGELPRPLSEAERWRRQEVSEHTEDLSGVINTCEPIETQSFKPNREEIFG